MYDHFLQAFDLQTNQVPERYSTSAVTRGRKESRDREMREMNGQRSFRWDLLVHYISDTGIREHKHQHIPRDHLVSTRETSTWAQ